MIQYKFNEDIQILEVVYEGLINLEDIVKFGHFIAENKHFPRKLNIVTDARSAVYNFNPQDVKKLQKQSFEKYESVHNAFLHARPKETAFSKLIEQEDQRDNYYHKIFSSLEAALEWLK